MQLVQALGGDGRPGRRHSLAGHARGAADSTIAPTCCEVAQSPLWGFGRVAINEYQNLRCRLVDLATCSNAEIASLAEELDGGAEAEDEIALHGELRYVRRLVPVAPSSVHGMGRSTRGSRASIPHRSGAAGNSRFAACLQCRAHAARTQRGRDRGRRHRPQLHGSDAGHGNASPGGDGGRFRRQAARPGVRRPRGRGRRRGFGVRRRRRGRCGQGLRLDLSSHRRCALRGAQAGAPEPGAGGDDSPRLLDRLLFAPHAWKACSVASAC